MKSITNTTVFYFFLLVICWSPVTGQYNESIYDRFLRNQGKFPKPQVYDTIMVGTFDVLTSKFEGIKSLSSPGSNLPLGYTNVGSQAKKHRLVFEVKNFDGAFTVTVNGRVASSSSGSNKVYVDEVDHGNITWSLEAGNKQYSDKFKIVKYPFVAAGVFKIPYLLVAIIYEPPPGSGTNNKATYRIKESFSAITAFSFSVDRNESKAIPTSIEDFKTKINSLSALLSVSKQTKMVGSVLSTLAEGLGSYRIEEVKGNVKENELVLEFTSGSGNQVSTNTPNRGGPGKGDVYFCLKGCKFLWYVEDERVYTTFLTSEGFFTPTADEMRGFINNAQTGQERIFLEELAMQNPFFKNPGISGLPAKRFGPPRELKCVSTFTGFNEEQTLLSSTNAVSTYSTQTQDYVAGWLGYLGFPAVNESKTVKTTINNRISRQAVKNTSIYNSYEIVDACGNYWFYLDNLYGTFVVTNNPPPDHSVAYSGTYRDNNGVPVPNSRFKILHKGKSYVAITNQYGEFKFYDPELRNYKQGKITALPKSATVNNNKN